MSLSASGGFSGLAVHQGYDGSREIRGSVVNPGNSRESLVPEERSAQPANVGPTTQSPQTRTQPTLQIRRGAQTRAAPPANSSTQNGRNIIQGDIPCAQDPGVITNISPLTDPQRLRQRNNGAALRLATLNIRGFGNPSVFHQDNKWQHIRRLISTRKIAILALQETHLSTERIETINCHFGKSLIVIGSPDPENPTGKSGVAIVLNTELFRPERIKKNVIVPGRALMVQLDHGPSSMNILAIYAPNVSGSDGAENAEFWRIIKDHLPSTKPEIMLGDCNITEAGMIDRLPAHDDPEEACVALDELKQRLQIRDGWRTTFPNEKRFTYLQSATGSQSRLDRIYATDKIIETAREWEIGTTGIPNLDHCIASVQITNEHAPWLGRGRWRIPDYVVEDKDFLTFAQEQGELAQKELEETQTRTSHQNPQRIWHQYKQKLIQKARARAHQIIPGLQRKINATELDLSRTLNDPLIPEKQKMENARTIQIKLAELEKTRMNKIQKEGKTKFRLEGETPTRYWSQ
ncbi:Endonuclease/exonuclease/phosphatase, partial [Lentinula detonsa]